jgi:hypothetical protein
LRRSGGKPNVFLSDTYYSERTSALVATSSGERRDTFNPISANNELKNMNNLFNTIWNSCK